MQHIVDEMLQLQARRRFLTTTGMGLGTTVMSSLTSATATAAGPSLPSGIDHVIFLFMAGAPSQLDLFDPKPQLAKMFKQPLPESVSNGQRVTAMTRGATQLIAPSMFRFSPQGESGLEMCELLPHLSKKADDLCVIRSMNTNAINHDPAKTFFCTGAEIPGKPSMGAWLSYGLGSMNRDLPDFVVLTSAFWTGGTRNVQALYSRLWGSGFLPSRHQGAAFQVAGDPVLYLSNPAGVDRDVRRRMLDAMQRMNQQHLQEVGDPEIRTTIAQQEMAFRMQASVPELTEIADEPQHVFDLYGSEVQKPGSYARNCLLARRMVERGVRFVQLFHRGWDHHNILPQQLRGQCFDVDQPSAALIEDLRQRGLLDRTMIVFAGEFGRTVYGQGKLERDDYGRDHHPRCFSAWAAGGGVKGGMSYGQTDDFSYNVAENPVAVRDLHATMLHQLGVDHRRLTFPFQGLDQRLTGVEEARVVHQILS
ncbi:MAG: DUF1501 domain-containing protein [Planctomycetaceae bacterium]|jgi:hypothetical protein